MEVFETFKPVHPIVAQYVDYYYLDIKPDNVKTEFECFPHYNNTLSLYQSHRRTINNEMIYEEMLPPFQIFTPVRENVLKVKQLGKVHRVVIVFKVLGIQQFFRNTDFTDLVTDVEFFTVSELADLYKTVDTQQLTLLLDELLQKRFKAFENQLLEKAIEQIFLTDEDFSVENLAEQLLISRRHLNRVFKANIGVSVKKFQEIVLFRKIVENRLFLNPKESFTKLAYEYNYSDQAHLNKTFENFTKNSPTQFFRKGKLMGSQDTFWHRIR